MKPLRVKKRNGYFEEFNSDKIWKAINYARIATKEFEKEDIDKVLNYVTNHINKKFISVEKIQDLIIKGFYDKGYTKTAENFIIHRYEHAKHRNHVDYSYLEIVDNYIGKGDWRVKENSNMAYSLQGLNNHIVSHVISQYWLNKIYPEYIRDAHDSGDMHIHDLSSYSNYCMGLDLERLLSKGFGGVSGKIESGPPIHLRTALLQMVNELYTIQGEAAGAVAYSHIDTLLAPYIRNDKLSYDEVKQSLQEFIFNLNVPTRVGYQSPFSNVTLDMLVPKSYSELYPVIGSKTMKFQYKDLQEEIDMFNTAFAEVMIEGDAKHRPFPFPIPTYNFVKGMDWNNERYIPIWNLYMRGIPYVANYVNSDMDPDQSTSMCPLKGTEEVVIRGKRNHLITKTLYGLYKDNKNEIFETFSDGKMVKAKVDKYNNQKLYKFKLTTNNEVTMADTHTNLAIIDNKIYNEISAKKLREAFNSNKKVYLPYSLKKLEGKGGDFNLGYLVGAYAGDGSIDENVVIFSLSQNKKNAGIVDKLIEIVEFYGATYSSTPSKKTKLLTFRVNSKIIQSIVTEFVLDMQREKHYSPKILEMSIEFREGLIAGHYATDGGNRHRIYSSSPKMVKSLNMLAASLGTFTTIYTDDRENRLGIEPNYAVLVHVNDRENYGDLYFKKDGFTWVKVKEIEKDKSGATTGYCLNIVEENAPKLFTIANSGITTHNCRLRISHDDRMIKGAGLGISLNPKETQANEEKEIRKGSVFAASPNTGSIGVCTINLPRLAYLSNTEDEFFEMIEEQMEIAKDSLEIKRKLVEDLTEKGLYPFLKMILSNIKKESGGYWNNHFSTIGMIGLNEAFLNMFKKDDIDRAPYSSVNPHLEDDLRRYSYLKEGKEWGLKVLKFMHDKVEEYSKETGNRFNLEQSPAEGCIAGDTKIKTVEFGNIPIKDLIGKEFGVWAYDEANKKVCIKKARNVHVTRKNTEVLEITLSNNKKIVVTPDHRIARRRPNRWGLPVIEWIEAKDLKEGNSIKSLYFKEKFKNGYIIINGHQKRTNILYEWYNNSKIEKGEVIHHKNRNKQDDSKVNLVKMTDTEHRRLHADPSRLVHGYGKDNTFFGHHHTEETKAKISQKKKGKPFVLKNISREEYSEIMSRSAKNKPKEKHSKYRKDIDTEEIIKLRNEGKTYKEIAKKLNCTHGLIIGRLKEVRKNHKIKKIRKLNYKVDVYNMEVEGTHSFFIDDGEDQGILIHNSSYRLAKIDKEIFPDIITSGGNVPYYTNSCHIPVNATTNPFELLDHQNDLTVQFTGGSVIHLFLNEKVDDPRAVKEVIKTICENYEIPYFTLSPTRSICPIHGGIIGEQELCEKDHTKEDLLKYYGEAPDELKKENSMYKMPMEIYSRVVGYYSPTIRWNKGKTQEFKDRNNYDELFKKALRKKGE